MNRLAAMRVVIRTPMPLCAGCLLAQASWEVLQS